MKKLLAVALITLILTSACAVTKGSRTERHIANPTTSDSTVVLLVHEEYNETTTYPWAIAMAVMGLIAGIAYVVNSK
jgi:hypothetical protein